MPHGEDTAHNPKRKVTRLAHLLANQTNKAWRYEGYYPADGRDVTPEDNQEYLDEYRNNRDTLGPDDIATKWDAQVIDSAFKNRHDDNYSTPMYYPFLSPNRPDL